MAKSIAEAMDRAAIRLVHKKVMDMTPAEREEVSAAAVNREIEALQQRVRQLTKEKRELESGPMSKKIRKLKQENRLLRQQLAGGGQKSKRPQ